MLESELGHRVEDDRKHPAVRHDRGDALAEVRRGERERWIWVSGLADGELADVAVFGPPDRAAIEELVLDEKDRALVVDPA